MKRIALAIVFVGLLALSSCVKHDVVEEIKFNVEVDEIGPYSSKITITHNGTNRDLYYGRIVEGDDIDIQKTIDELLDLYMCGQLNEDIFTQRKKVFVLSGLSPEKTYTYLVFGISKDGTQYGTPGIQSFTTTVSNFTAVENPNWSVTYLGQCLHNNGYFSKVRVTVTGEIEERYFLSTYPLSTYNRFDTEEEFIAYAVDQFNINNVENNPDYWLESSSVMTQSCLFYQYRDEDDYISYAIGINANGSPTGHYAKSESFHIDKYPMTAGYANLLGDWVLTDKDGKTFYVTFEELRVNRTAKMIGWGNYDLPIEVIYNQSDMSLRIKEQLSKDNVLFHLDGEPIWGDLYMKGWYQNLSEQTESIKDIPYLAKATCASIGSPYSFEPMFTVTFTNGATAEATGLAYELHVEDNSGFYRFSKMVFPFTMTKQ